MEVRELNKKIRNHKPKTEVEAMIKKMRAEDEKLVKGQFEFVEAEGGFFEFALRLYPGDQIQIFKLIHGEICTIPMGVVKHLNGTKKKIRRYKNVEQPQNGPVRIPMTFETTSRVRFVPVDFLNENKFSDFA
jgi:hypothetical protein